MPDLFHEERKRAGFTLAEILLVITIIGVIATLTIPNLLITIQKQSFVTALKKDYADFANAYKLLQAEGTDMKTAFPGTDDGLAALNMIAPKLNLIKNCGSNPGCLPTSPFYGLNGILVNASGMDAAYSASNFGKAILANGGMFFIIDNKSNCTTTIAAQGFTDGCGYIYIDVNGEKEPNILGRDVFMFTIRATGVYPNGTQNGIANCNTTKNGSMCAARVITEGAMNY